MPIAVVYGIVLAVDDDLANLYPRFGSREFAAYRLRDMGKIHPHAW